jgi:hypothetical protein
MLQDPCLLIPLSRDDHYMWPDPEDLKIYLQAKFACVM